jgi:protease I
MAAKKVLLLVGDFAEDYEVMLPFQGLSMLGHAVHAVCPGRKAGERVKTSVHDFEGDQTYVERLGHYFTLNADFEAARPEAYDALLIPGGRAPEYLRLNPKVLDLARGFAKAAKPIVAICHGIQVLTAAGVVKGRACTSYAALEPEVRAAGGEWVALGDDGAHVDGNLVTGTTWASTGACLARLLKLLGTKIDI